MMIYCAPTTNCINQINMKKLYNAVKIIGPVKSYTNFSSRFTMSCRAVDKKYVKISQADSDTAKATNVWKKK